MQFLLPERMFILTLSLPKGPPTLHLHIKQFLLAYRGAAPQKRAKLLFFSPGPVFLSAVFQRRGLPACPVIG